MILVCKVSDVPDSGGLRVDIPGLKPLAVFRAGSEYFVIDDTCTHGSASLSEGEVIGFEIECPYHFGAFDLRTGKATAAPCSVALQTYRTELHNGMVFIEDSPSK
jgi:nitrite reductase/ring-hydroxylating ferredoxin subunit